jgi:hypothetical protein
MTVNLGTCDIETNQPYDPLATGPGSALWLRHEYDICFHGSCQSSQENSKTGFDSSSGQTLGIDNLDFYNGEPDALNCSDFYGF